MSCEAFLLGAGYLYLEINLIVLITGREYLDEGLRSCKETGCYERNKIENTQTKSIRKFVCNLRT